MDIPALKAVSIAVKQIQSPISLLDQALNLHPQKIQAQTSLAAVVHLLGLSSHNDTAHTPSDHYNSCALILEEDQLVGIITERDIVKLIAENRLLDGLTVESCMSRQVITLKAEDDLDIFSALNIMRRHRIRHLPMVNEQGHILGLLTPRSLRNLLEPADLMRLRQVHEVMNAKVVHALPTASVLEIAQTMAQHRVSCVVLVAAAAENAQATAVNLHPVGIITERDIIQFQRLALNLVDTTAQEVMSAPLSLVRPEDSLWAVHQTMHRHRVRRLVVADLAGILQGIVTQSSLLPVDPVEMYKVVGLLQQQVLQLETERAKLLKHHNQELQNLVAQKTLRLERRDQMLRSLALGAGTKTGEDFWRSLVSCLTEALPIDYAVVGKIECGKVHTLAVYGEGQVRDNFECDALGSLCGSATTGQPNTERKDVSSLFPPELLLRDHPIQGYLGIPLYGSTEAMIGAIGVLIVLSRQPFEELAFIEEVLSIFAMRAESELDRQCAESAHRLIQQTVQEQAALLDVATDAILVRSLEGPILFWNKGAETIYGWTLEEALAHSADQLLYRKGLAKDKHIYADLMQQGSWQGELHQVTKEKKDIVVMSRWSLVRDEQGTPTSILTVNTDITEAKQREVQFLRAQRLESVGTLASGIAHDLNNILTPIYGIAQLLPMQLPDVDEKMKQQFEILQTSARRGSEIIHQVLAFSKGEDGDHAALAVQHLITELKSLICKTFPKSLDLSVDVPTDLWEVEGDATQLHQVLMNLVVNARDAMPNGGKLSLSATNLTLDEVFVSCHLEAKVGPYILLSVADTGEGISPEQQERIFEPFFTSKQDQGGTGLGLSTVHGIVNCHGGFITVYSEVGKGTQFNVYLPAIKSDSAALEPPPMFPSGQGECVLVVDDERPIREVTKSILERHNYTVLLATDGIDAIAQCAEHKASIKVVLMDMTMPNLDATTPIRVIARLNPRIQMIAVSGLPGNEQVAKILGENVKAFILKPYSSAMLLNTLHDLLEAK